jgi:hypothetical protein
MPGFGIRISGNTITSTAAPHVSSIVFMTSVPPATSTISTVTTATISGGVILIGKN